MHNSVKLTDESKSVLINDIDNDGFGEGGKNTHHSKIPFSGKEDDVSNKISCNFCIQL